MAEQLLNGRYRVLRPLGTGGMASVYLAEDLRLGRRVAVKILHEQFASDPSFVARFEGEGRMAAALSHPNIVQIYDVGHDNDRRYIVMEYVEGETLKETVARQGALPVPRALAIIGGVLSALEFAHAHNLIHRDIKAQNILLTRDGAVKVTDFGIAREVGGGAAPTLTATGMIIGTAQYFSPEQAQGRPATAQSDVYSAGVVLYEMLTGRLPFEGDNPFAVAMQQINGVPPRPTRLNAAIPPAVEAVVLRALAKDPTARFASARDMKAAVDGALGGSNEPTRVSRASTAPTVVARPTTPPSVPRPAVGSGATAPTAPRVTVSTAAPPPRPPRRGLWPLVLFVAALLALGAGYLVAHGGAFGGGGATPTETPTVLTTATGAATDTPAPATATGQPVVIPPASATPSATPVPTPYRRAATATATAVVVADTATAALASETPAASDTPTAPPPTDTRSPNTDTPTATPVPATPTTVPTATSRPVPSNTPTPVPTATPTPRPSNTPTATPVPSNTPTPTTAPSNTPTTAPTATPTAVPSNTPTTAPSNTPAPPPTATPLPATPTIVPTATSVSVPSDTPAS